MIVDTFPLLNELELLEVRLHELDPVVDRFVVVEATRTHSNRPKPLVFAEHRARFERFAAKITHVVVDDAPDTSDAWEIEKFQRDATLRGLGGCVPDDVILMSDVDEIPRAEKVLEAAARLPPVRRPLERVAHRVLRSRFVRHPLRRVFKRFHPFLVVFELTPYWGFLNLRCRDLTCLGTRACRFGDLTRPRELRGLRGRVVRDGGWHFGSMGGRERIREKLAAFAHREYDTPGHTDPARIDRLLAEGGDLWGQPVAWTRVEIDERHPRWLRDNLDRFEGWIMPPPAAGR